MCPIHCLLFTVHSYGSFIHRSNAGKYSFISLQTALVWNPIKTLSKSNRIYYLMANSISTISTLFHFVSRKWIQILSIFKSWLSFELSQNKCLLMQMISVTESLNFLFCIQNTHERFTLFDDYYGRTKERIPQLWRTIISTVRKKIVNITSRLSYKMPFLELFNVRLRWHQLQLAQIGIHSPPQTYGKKY